MGEMKEMDRENQTNSAPRAGYRKLRNGWWMDMSITETDGTEKRKSKMVDKGGGVEVVWRFKRVPQGGLNGHRGGACPWI